MKTTRFFLLCTQQICRFLQPQVTFLSLVTPSATRSSDNNMKVEILVLCVSASSARYIWIVSFLCNENWASFQGIKRLGFSAVHHHHHHHLLPRLKDRTIPLFPIWALMDCHRMNFTFELLPVFVLHTCISVLYTYYTYHNLHTIRRSIAIILSFLATRWQKFRFPAGLEIIFLLTSTSSSVLENPNMFRLCSKF